MLSWISQNRSRKKIAAIFVGIFFVAVFLFFISPIAFAQGESSNAIDLGLTQAQSVGLGADDIRLIIARVIRAVLALLGVISLSLILYAGYTIMTAAGNEEKVAQGKKILMNAVIGLAIIFSSLAITQFIINALMKATGIGVEEAGPAGPKIEYFAGSGALGDIIKDHYPTRDQTGVARNTKIIITFREPMDPISFIDDVNQNGIYGDCLIEEKDFDWEKHCDHLKTNPANFSIYLAEEKDKEGNLLKTPIGAAAMASYDAKNEAYTFVFRPFTALGNDTDNVWYTVHLNNDIMKKNCPDPKNCPSAFDDLNYKFYEWQFQTDTNFDYAPPHVVSVYPQKDVIAPRNSIVQINFNEPMDPTAVQGVLKNGIKDDDFINIIFNNTTMGGEWKVTNGYKTVEFISDLPCGENSCGEEMYCLSVECKSKNCVDNYATLVRTARLLSLKTFEAAPFTGVMDASGNALDGDNDGMPDSQPVKDKDGNFQLIGGEEHKADNYLWNYKVENKIDRVPPHIEQVLPGLDAGAVGKNEDVKIYFSKMMWMSTLDDIGLTEYPAAKINNKEVSFYHRIFSEIVDNADKTASSTLSHIEHREFGPNGIDYYYLPIIPHTVKSVNQNCLYPGFGPHGLGGIGSSPTCSVSYNEDGVSYKSKNCVPVIASNPEKDTGCAQTIETDVGNELIQTNSSTSTCLEYLKSVSPEFTPVKPENK